MITDMTKGKPGQMLWRFSLPMLLIEDVVPVLFVILFLIFFFVTVP